MSKFNKNSNFQINRSKSKVNGRKTYQTQYEDVSMETDSDESVRATFSPLRKKSTKKIKPKLTGKQSKISPDALKGELKQSL